MDTSLPRDRWRFNNGDSTRVPIVENLYAYLLSHHTPPAGLLSWDDIKDIRSIEGIDPFAFSYTFGVPLSVIYRIVEWYKIILKNFIEVEIQKNEGKRAPVKYLQYLGYSLLMNDASGREDSITLIRKSKDNSDVDTSLTKPIHFELLYELIVNPMSSELLKLAERCEDAITVTFSNIYPAIALNDSVQFNAALAQELISMIDTEDKRRRKRKVYPTELVLLVYTAIVAFALDRGIRLEVVDSAIPIWDFPIAQRPEIQKLLPKEALERIPNPNE